MIVQDNAITMANYELSEMEHNLMYALVTKIQENDKPFEEYKISKDDISVDGSSNAYRNMKSAIDRLLKRTIDIGRMDGSRVQMAFISSAVHNPNTSTIIMRVDPNIFPYYLDLKMRFTTIRREVALKLSGKYSKRLYEMLSMVKNLTPKSLSMSIEEFKKKLYIIDDKGNDNYPDVGSLRQRVINPAIEKINQIAEFTVEYMFLNENNKPASKGRNQKAVKIIFEIEFKPVADAGKSNDMKLRKLYERLTKEYSLRKDQANSILMDFSESEITKKLYEIDVKNMHKAIENIGAYTASIFNVK